MICQTLRFARPCRTNLRSTSTDLHFGDQLVAQSNWLRTEGGASDYTFRNGLSYPTGREGAPLEMEIQVINMATALKADHKNAGLPIVLGDLDATEVAHQ